MFCYQCEQTAKSEACTVRGVCGKQSDVAAIQDALVFALKGLAVVAKEAAPEGLVPSDTYPFLAEGLFTTLTNVNFDPDALVVWVQETAERRDAVKASLAKKKPGLALREAPVSFVPAATAELVANHSGSSGVGSLSYRSPLIDNKQPTLSSRQCFSLAGRSFSPKWSRR